MLSFSFILTADAAEIACVSTEILQDGKCVPANYINPIYWWLIASLVMMTILAIVYLKMKHKRKNYLFFDNEE